MTHSRHGQYSPPHAVQEGPFAILKLRVSLNEEDQRSEGENGHSNQDHHQAEFLVSLLQSALCDRQGAKKCDIFMRCLNNFFVH